MDLLKRLLKVIREMDAKRRAYLFVILGIVFVMFWAFITAGVITGNFNRTQIKGAENDQKVDAVGIIITETKDGIATTRTYDGTGALLSSKTSAGTINYNYLSNGNVSAIYNSNTLLVRFGYDDYGRRTSIYTQDTGTRSTSYNQTGNVSSEVDANGNRINYSYDNFSRLTRKETSDGLITTYTYDDKGNLVQESTNNGVRKIYEYDRLGRISNEFQIENYKNSSNVGYDKFYIYTNGQLKEAIHTLERNNTTTELLGIETSIEINEIESIDDKDKNAENKMNYTTK
mgnify:CR=1 FL=1